MEGYATVQEIAERWGLTHRRVQKMCEDGKIPGVTRFGRAWVLPEDAERPVDERITTGAYRNWRKKKEE